MNQEEFQKLILEKFNSIDKRFDKLDNDIAEVKLDIKDLKNGQEEIKDMIRNLEANNADRHIEISKKIELLEEVTANNWTDIIKLKKAK